MCIPFIYIEIFAVSFMLCRKGNLRGETPYIISISFSKKKLRYVLKIFVKHLNS